jgi:hypothetical protein
LGIIVLAKERGSHVGSTFAFMTSSTALWLLATAAIYSASFADRIGVDQSPNDWGGLDPLFGLYLHVDDYSATSPISDLGVEQRYTFCPLLSQHHFD